MGSPDGRQRLLELVESLHGRSRHLYLFLVALMAPCLLARKTCGFFSRKI